MKTTVLAIALMAISASAILAQDKKNTAPKAVAQDKKNTAPKAAVEHEMPSAVYVGYDTFSGSVKSMFVTGDTPKMINPVSGNDITVCTTTNDVKKVFGVEASASASYGVVTASAKTKYSSQLEVSDKSCVVVVHAWNRITYQASNPKWGDASKPTPALTAQTFPDFFKKNGDSYLKELTVGNEYFATYTCTSTSTKANTDFVAKLKVAVASAGSVSLSTTMTNATASGTTKVERHQLMLADGIPLPANLDPDTIIQFGATFPTQAFKSVTPIKATIEGYEKIAPTTAIDLTQMVTNRGRFRVGDAYNTDSTKSGGWQSKLQTLKKLVEQIEAIKKTYGFYDYDTPVGKADSQLLDQHLVTAKKDITSLTHFIAAVVANPLAAPTDIALESLTYGVPKLDWELKDVLLYQGDSTNPPQFRDVYHVDEHHHVRITHITKLDYANFAYLDGLWIEVNNNGSFVQHGKGFQNRAVQPATDTTQNLVLGKGEWISQVTCQGFNDGSYNVVTRLSFTTNKGKKLTAAPNGQGTAVTWPKNGKAKENERLVGFSGTAAEYISTFNATILTMKPAKWHGGLPKDAGSGK